MAVQSCQCSTMPVKQEKKSSNKWSCVICHQKQSVRQIFSRCLLVRDVRQMVQQFNMSRQLAKARPPPPPVAVPHEAPPLGEIASKRTDWTEYLEDPEDGKEIEGADSDGEVEVITELPQRTQVFGKMRVRRNTKAASSNHSFDSKESGGRTRRFRPLFTKRKDILLYLKESIDAKRTKHQQATQQVSKWNLYLEEEGKLIEIEPWVKMVLCKVHSMGKKSKKTFTLISYDTKEKKQYKS